MNWTLVLIVVAALLLVGLLLRRALAKRVAEQEDGPLRPEALLRVLDGAWPVLLAVDVSGSMYPFRATQEAWVEAFRKAGAEVVTFDHEIHPVDPDLTVSSIRYGGGTSYEVVRKYVEGLRHHPAVVVLSDGVARPFEVAHPGLWHWALIDDSLVNPWRDRLPGFVYTAHQEGDS